MKKKISRLERELADANHRVMELDAREKDVREELDAQKLVDTVEKAKHDAVVKDVVKEVKAELTSSQVSCEVALKERDESRRESEKLKGEIVELKRVLENRDT